MNNGDGTFKTELIFPAGDMPYGIVLADLNGDGQLELASTNLADDNLTIMFNGY